MPSTNRHYIPNPLLHFLFLAVRIQGWLMAHLHNDLTIFYFLLFYYFSFITSCIQLVTIVVMNTTIQGQGKPKEGIKVGRKGERGENRKRGRVSYFGFVTFTGCSWVAKLVYNLALLWRLNNLALARGER